MAIMIVCKTTIRFHPISIFIGSINMYKPVPVMGDLWHCLQFPATNSSSDAGMFSICDPIETCQFGKLDTASLGGAAWMPTIAVVEKVGTTITTLKNGGF